MGLLNLFRKDAGAALDKAESRLQSGNLVGALDLARKHIQDKDPGQRERAQELVTRSRQALIRSSLEKADAAEASGDPADAADWIRAALQHVTDDDRREELEARHQELEQKAEQSGLEPDWDAAVRRDREEIEEQRDAEEYEAGDTEDDDALAARIEETAPETAEPVELDPIEAEIRFDLLVDTLNDEVGERYADRGDDFRRAYLAINDGEPERALGTLDELLAADPGDPVLHLERGRCRFMTDDAAGARDDLEMAWEALGDDHLDRAESLRLPTLWAEASLVSGEPEPVLERLGELARPEAGDGDLTAVYGHALVQDGRLDEAREFLVRAGEAFPKRQDLPLVLAQVLAVLGERQLAIQLLERSVAPSCAGGNCSKPPLHLPSLRALAALHLGLVPHPVSPVESPSAEERMALPDDDAYTPQAANLDRVEDLMRWIAGAQGGRLSGIDHFLAARYHDLVGDEPRAAEARRLAARQVTANVEAAAGPGDLAASTGEAAL